jgi:hypothetical protein
MYQGEWLGNWEGEWFGALGPPNPNAMVGSTTIALSATGTLTSAGGVTPADMVGSATFGLLATGTATQPTQDTQSGVSRLDRSTPVDRKWLAAITAELNGMNEVPKETSAQAKPIKQLLTKFIEEADGSITILDPVEVVKTTAPIVTPRPIKIKRPQTVSWAYNIFIELIQTSPVDLWAEEKVLQVLQQAAQEAADIEAEDELIIELAAQLLF